MSCTVNCVYFPTSFLHLSPNFKIELLSFVLLSFSELLVQLETQNAIEMCFLVTLRFNWESGMFNIKLTIRPLQLGREYFNNLGLCSSDPSNLIAESFISVPGELYRQRHENKYLFVVLKVIRQLFSTMSSSAYSLFRNSCCLFLSLFIYIFLPCHFSDLLSLETHKHLHWQMF